MTKNLINFAFASIFIPLAMGCSQVEKKDEMVTLVSPASLRSYDVSSYQFQEAHCSTGSHSFEGHEEFCESLRNETVNRNCARDARVKAFFEKDCPTVLSE